MPQTVETIDEYLKRGKTIKQLELFKEKDRSDFEFPIYPKGKAIQGQGKSNLMIPRYSQA